MRFIKVLILLVFFFVCMLFFVQNTTTLETPLVLRLSAFGLSAESPGAPFYVVLLLSFVAGGLFSTIYFLVEKIRLSAQVRKLSAKVRSLEEKQSATPVMPTVTPFTAAPTISPAAACDTDEQHQGA